MSVNSVVKDVCRVVGVEVFPSLFANIATERTQDEMLACANEMAQRIAWNTRDWQKLIATATFHGDGVITAFPLPADYVRMLKDSNVWKQSQPNIPVIFIPSADEWLRRTMTQYWPFAGQFTIQGGQMLVQPPLGVGDSVSFIYLSNKIINNVAPPGVTSTFTNDDDTFLLDERLLKLAMITEWKQHKGSPYAEDMATYQDAVMNAMGADKPAPIIVGNMPLSANMIVSTSYPWPLPTP